MKIHNIRLGMATNSSSSHSIVVIPDGTEYYDELNMWREYHYGREQFILASPEEKAKYLHTAFASNLERIFDPEKTIELMKEWFGVDMSDKFYESSYGNYLDIGIDHQSSLSFDPGILNKEFCDTLLKYMSRDDIVIFGGSDEDDYPMEPSNAEEVPFFKAVTDTRSVKIRSDKGNFIVFNKESGNKTRFSFDDDAVYEKSTAPELVDVKITNFCPFGCDFCYQASTKNGNHASIEYITDLAESLKEMGVFEVAIGGGEPTMHPNFLEILNIFKDNEITPNFTTYSTHWLKNEKLAKFIKNTSMGIGVSVHNVSDLDKVLDIRKSNIRWNQRVIAQHVVGSTDIQTTLDIIRKCADKYIHLLLLGYKDVGFGKQYQNYSTEGFEFMLKLLLDEKDWNMTLSVDTAMLTNFPDLPKVMNNINETLFTLAEGKFSCYVDAIQHTMGPSSYSTTVEMVPCTNNVDEFLDIFSKW